MIPVFQPLQVVRKPRPFNGSDWLFELKYDGFRALAYLDHGRCRLVSRNGHPFASFVELASSIAKSVDGITAVFDGEIVCVDRKGRPRFDDLLFRRGEPRFFAFDLLYLNGKDLRHDQLVDRKAALRLVLGSRRDASINYADHLAGSGVALYEQICKLDLEGMVAKHRSAPYVPEDALSTWYKVKNPNYSQMAGRHELFERERHREPVPGWHSCDLACAEVEQNA
jgi:bifunctional non-homologous end joining protein LigD